MIFVREHNDTGANDDKPILVGHLPQQFLHWLLALLVPPQIVLFTLEQAISRIYLLSI